MLYIPPVNLLYLTLLANSELGRGAKKRELWEAIHMEMCQNNEHEHISSSDMPNLEEQRVVTAFIRVPLVFQRAQQYTLSDEEPAVDRCGHRHGDARVLAAAGRRLGPRQRRRHPG